MPLMDLNQARLKFETVEWTASAMQTRMLSCPGDPQKD